jgi:intracellular sulfur oxidation DsrE/DsrF family protein
MRDHSLRAIGLLSLLLGPASPVIWADEPADAPTTPIQVVFHVNFSEPGRQGQGLKNIENILKETGDSGAVIEVVCHGQGIGLVEAARTDHATQLAALMQRGVTFVACRNTMKQKAIPPEALIPGVGVVPAGALEVIRKQQQGFAYFKP